MRDGTGGVADGMGQHRSGGVGCVHGNPCSAMSAFTLEEMLEADWVAARPQAFQEWEKHKFLFTMTWNKIEGKFTITCHNRTAQCQRSGSRELYRCDPEARTSPKASIPMVNRGPA